MIAVQEAHAIFFMVDAATGITDLDTTMAHILRKIRQTVYLVVNKVDNHDRFLEAQEFYQLGIEKIFFLASNQWQWNRRIA
jgi:GTP-binding protein